MIQRVKQLEIRSWYMKKTLEQGWSQNVLEDMLNASAYQRQGKAITNFEVRLSSPQSDLAQEVLKDPYVFDFL